MNFNLPKIHRKGGINFMQGGFEEFFQSYIGFTFVQLVKGAAYALIKVTVWTWVIVIECRGDLSQWVPQYCKISMKL